MKLSPQQKWKYNQVIYAELLDELDKHFKAINVCYMPIKGAYLIGSGLAEKMTYRRMDDVDILVKKEDFENVCGFLSFLPQVKFLKHRWYFEKEFAYSMGSFICYLEIHSLLNESSRFDLSTEKLFERALPCEGMRVVPCFEDAMVILICHLIVHIAHEMRETVFEEISLISKHKDFKWEKFWSIAKTTNILPFFHFILFWYKNSIAIIDGIGSRYSDDSNSAYSRSR